MRLATPSGVDFGQSFRVAQVRQGASFALVLTQTLKPAHSGMPQTPPG
jgi:hypothetical protein